MTDTVRRTLTPFERAAVRKAWDTAARTRQPTLHWTRQAMSQSNANAMMLVEIRQACDTGRATDFALNAVCLSGEVAREAFKRDAGKFSFTDDERSAVRIQRGGFQILAHAIVGASDCWWVVLADGRYAVAVRTPKRRVVHCLQCNCDFSVEWDAPRTVPIEHQHGEATLSVDFSTVRPGRWYRAALKLTAEHRALLDAALAHGSEFWDVLGDALEATGQARRGKGARTMERWPEPSEWPERWRTA